MQQRLERDSLYGIMTNIKVPECESASKKALTSYNIISTLRAVPPLVRKM